MAINIKPATSKIDNIKAAIKSKAAEESSIRDQIVGLGDDTAPPLARVHDAVSYISSLWKEDDVPTSTIQVGLREVMKLLKEYEDVALELEPEDIGTIVSSYMALADEEVRTIFDKAAKKKTATRKKAMSKKDKDEYKAIKEGGLDLGDLIL